MGPTNTNILPITESSTPVVDEHNSPELSSHGVEHPHECLPLLPLSSILVLSARRFFATLLALFAETPLLERNRPVGRLLEPLLPLLIYFDDVIIVLLQIFVHAAPALFRRFLGRH